MGKELTWQKKAIEAINAGMAKRALEEDQSLGKMPQKMVLVESSDGPVPQCIMGTAGGFYEPNSEITFDVLRYLSTITEAERVEFFEQIKSAYCEHCGCEQVGARCQCDNDD